MAKINSKKKGNRVEREIAQTLTERFNKPFKRVPMSGAWGTNNQQEDIRQDAMEILSGDLIVPKDFKFSIEVKSRKSFNFFDFFNKGSELHEWMEQCLEDAKKSDKLPMLIVKINYHEPFVLTQYPIKVSDMSFQNWQIITLEQFLELEDDLFFKTYECEEVPENT